MVELVFMIQKIKHYLLQILMKAIILAMLALLIWYVARSSALTYKDTLFWAGALPIALFSITIFGSFSARGDPEAQFSKTVLPRSPHQRSIDEHNDLSSGTSKGLSWFLAGLIVWLFSYFL